MNQRLFHTCPRCHHVKYMDDDCQFCQDLADKRRLDEQLKPRRDDLAAKIYVELIGASSNTAQDLLEWFRFVPSTAPYLADRAIELANAMITALNMSTSITKESV